MIRGISTELPLSSLQKNMTFTLIDNDVPSSVALSFLESQIMASTALHSTIEFKYWLLMTVNHLLEKGKLDTGILVLLWPKLN